MKKALVLFLVLVFSSSWRICAAPGDAVDWYLYFYSNTYSLDGNVGRFIETETYGVYLLEGCEVTASGINFCVHNEAWSSMYGWADGGSVNATGVDYPVAVATAATGWLALPAGTYDVTFNLSALTIRFDTAIESHDEYPMPDLNGDYLRGGDISMLTYVESFGAKFYDADGTEKDVIDIMKENGCNIVRLRLYNNPGTPVTYSNNTYKVPAGYLDEADVLRLARRAKKKGLRVQLSFHYSDFWTNGGIQFKPHDWQELTLDGLKTAIYNYTKQFLQKMKQQGTTPEYVSLGNEIESGFLFGDATAMDAVNGGWNKPANQAALLGKASQAVREVCPESKIIIHYTLSQNIGWTRYKTLLTNLKNNGYTDYDIVGTSYYPYWTDQKPTMLNSLANNVYNNFGKELLVMETGYSWTQYRPSGRNGGNYEGQLHMNGTPYNEASKEGQKAFMEELHGVIEDNSHLLGYLYWDPIMVDQKVNNKWIETAWAYRQDGDNWWQDGNIVSNTTWFDYEGKALPVLEAIKAAADAATGLEIIDNGKLKIDNDDVFDLQGRRRVNPTKGLYIVGGKKVVISK